MTRLALKVKISPVYPMLVLSILAVVFGYLFFHQPLREDDIGYYNMSLELRRWEPTSFYWPLGWPAMMAVAQAFLGESVGVAKGLSFLLVLSTLWVQLAIVRRGLPKDSAPWRYWLGYGIIVVNAPALLYQANFIFTNVPMAFFLTLLVYTLLYTESSLAPAVLVALITTVRFGSIFLLPFVLLYKWLRGSSLKPLLSMSIVFVLLISIPIALASLTLGRLVFISTNNNETVFLANDRLAPLYAVWQWGKASGDKTPEKQEAVAQLKTDYSLRADLGSDLHPSKPILFSLFGNGGDSKGSGLEIDQAMYKKGMREILDYPGIFLLRVLSRLSLLLAFDSSMGSEQIKFRDNKIIGILLLLTMLIVSLSTKSAAVVGLFGTKWPGRHLIWVLLVALSIPHLLSIAHPSYMQMFMNGAISVVALSAAQVDILILKQLRRVVLGTAATIVLCHAAFIYYMASTRGSQIF
jgi:hypothetical protein